MSFGEGLIVRDLSSPSPFRGHSHPVYPVRPCAQFRVLLQLFLRTNLFYSAPFLATEREQAETKTLHPHCPLCLNQPNSSSLGFHCTDSLQCGGFTIIIGVYGHNEAANKLMNRNNSALKIAKRNICKK